MRTLTKDSLKNWEAIDWHASVTNLTNQAIAATGVRQDFNYHHQPDGSVQFSWGAIASGPPETERIDKITNELFERFDWIVYEK